MNGPVGPSCVAGPAALSWALGNMWSGIVRGVLDLFQFLNDLGWTSLVGLVGSRRVVLMVTTFSGGWHIARVRSGSKIMGCLRLRTWLFSELLGLGRVHSPSLGCSTSKSLFIYPTLFFPSPTPSPRLKGDGKPKDLCAQVSQVVVCVF